MLACCSRVGRQAWAAEDIWAHFCCVSLIGHNILARMDEVSSIVSCTSQSICRTTTAPWIAHRVNQLHFSRRARSFSHMWRELASCIRDVSLNLHSSCRFQ